MEEEVVKILRVLGSGSLLAIPEATPIKPPSMIAQM